VVKRASSSLSSGQDRIENKILRTAARKLTAHDPAQRSSMLQVAESLSDVANVAVRRKASRSLRDTVDVDREKAEPPRAKKQKLSVPEEDGASRTLECVRRKIDCGNLSQVAIVRGG
jgi:hypothetical protein